jgi:branched-chain amino acid transport system substrate-binding protein
MNLWAILSELGPDATSEDIVAAFRATEEHPSFDGHPYTCDGEQIPDLPSMCAAQQIIAELGPNGEFTEVSDGWIDVPTVLQETLG